MEGAEHEVPRLGRLDGDRDGLQVTHFADEHDVRILAQGGPQSVLEGIGVRVDLALVNEALLVLVDEFDRVLDRDDVVGAIHVDMVDQRGERRRLARAGRTGDEHEPLSEVAQLEDGLGQSDLLR